MAIFRKDLFLGMFLPIVVLIVYALLPVRRNKETGEVLAQKKTNPWLIAIVMSLFLIAFSNALGGSPESQSNGGSTMTIILIIAVVIVIMMISGAWRLGGGISDWIDNQAAEKRKRDEEK